MDDSSEDLGTIQVSATLAAFTCWSHFTIYSFPEAPKTYPQCRIALLLSPGVSELNFQCRDDVSALNRRFGIEKSSLLQVPSPWRPQIEDMSNLQLLFNFYSSTSPPLSSMALECLVRLHGSTSHTLSALVIPELSNLQVNQQQNRPKLFGCSVAGPLCIGSAVTVYN